MRRKTVVTWRVTHPWDMALAGALVEAQGVRRFRKSLDQSCRLDALIVPHHGSFLTTTAWMQPAAQESVTRGKQLQLCPVFYVLPGLPPPSPHLLYLCTPCQAQGSDSNRGPARGGTPAGELRFWTFPGAMPQCEQRKRQWDLFLPLASLRCTSLPGHSRGGAAPCQPRPAAAETRCRCFPFAVTPRVCRALSSPFLHVPGQREES